MKRLIIMVSIAVLLFSAIAVSQVGVKDYHPVKWQQAYCPADGDALFAVIGHGSSSTADTSAIYTVPAFSEVWLRILVDDADAATGTDSIDTDVVIQVRDTRWTSSGMTYSAWKRIDSVNVVVADTLYGVWYEATKIPPCSHIRTIVKATSDCDRGGETNYPHWIVFKQ